MQNAPARILVTGAAGALAKRVIAALKEDYPVVAVDFRDCPELNGDIPGYCVDFNKRGFEDVFRRHRLAGVIHLGRALFSESTAKNRYNANVLGTRRLLDLCLKYQVAPVLVLSTCYVYGAHPYNPALLDEETPLKAAQLSLNLVDAVELENLTSIYLWKYPQLNITLLRPCHIVGPGMHNGISLLLSRKLAPVLAGFSPLMQFIHVDDMARAILLAFRNNRPGVYNIAPQDWIPYRKALEAGGCIPLPLPSIPTVLARGILALLRWKALPSYLVNYLKYPVIIDGSLFEKTFGFQPEHSLAEIFRYYREQKAVKPTPAARVGGR